MKYYRIVNRFDEDPRWFLGAPFSSYASTTRDIDPRRFTSAIPVERFESLEVAVRQLGRPVDFTFADFDMPVVTTRVAEIIETMAPRAVQRIPVQMPQDYEPREILNVVKSVKSLNEQKSVSKWWTEHDGRPDKIGQYRLVGNIVLRRNAVCGHHIFRIDGWLIALVISSALKEALEEASITGVKFKQLELSD